MVINPPLPPRYPLEPLRAILPPPVGDVAAGNGADLDFFGFIFYNFVMKKKKTSLVSGTVRTGVPIVSLLHIFQGPFTSEHMGDVSRL